MKISSLIALLEKAQKEHGDLTVSCMTAPFHDGETEVLTSKLIGVSENPPNNGVADTQKVFTVGYQS